MNDPFERIPTLTDQELEANISRLTKIYWQTPNPYLKEQIVSQLDAHKLEYQSRQAKKYQESQENLDDGLDNLINIS